MQNLILTPQADGSWTAFDPATSRAWKLTSTAADAVRAVQRSEDSGDNASPRAGSSSQRDLDQAEVLRRAGLLDADGTPTLDSDEQGRVTFWTVRTPTNRVLRSILQRFGLAVPVVSLAALFAALWFAWDDVGRAFHSLFSSASNRSATLALILGVNYALMLSQLIPHEWGHAVTLAACSGREVKVGLRLWRFSLQAFADTTALVTLPARSQRLAVLLAGVGVELFFWSALIVGAKLSGLLAHPAVCFSAIVGGPFTLTRNILLPFLKNDGYFVLRELTGVNRLSREGAQAAVSLMAADARTPARWWLPWYGALELLLAGCAYGLGGAAIVSVFAGAGRVALATGLLSGLGGAWWTYRRNLAT